MNPTRLLELADQIDTEQLWRLSGLNRDKLTPEQNARLMAGVTIRRYAAHVQRMIDAYAHGRSVLFTPLSDGGNSFTMKEVETPADHERLRK